MRANEPANTPDKLQISRKEWKYTKTQLLRVYAAACETRESIREKYVNVPDLESVLLEEGQIKVV